MSSPHRRLSRLMFAALLAVLALPAPSRATERSEVPVALTWDLTSLFPSDDAWTAARKDLEARVPTLARFKGHLGDAPDTLYAALTTQSNLRRSLERLGTYASQLADQDQRVARHIEMRQASQQLQVQMGTVASYIQPELLALGEAKLRALTANDKRFDPYRPGLDDVLRYAPHTNSAAEERIAAQAGRMAGAGFTVRGLLNNAEMPWPTVTLPSGKSVTLDDAAYTSYRQSADRADRDSVFHAFFRQHQKFQGTYGAALDAAVQSHIFDRDVHSFKTCLEQAMYGDNIPTTVYTHLLQDVHENLPTLHRYLKLRQRMMGLSDLRYEDLYAPIVSKVDLRFTPAQAMEIVLDTVKPLGQAYVDTLKHGFASRWIDWLPSTGKASGAYSTGAYGVHPYQLQNFTGRYDEVSTLAHESGHSMHTYLSDSHQPYPTHGYATFVAEVASTLNENLLFHRMLDKTTDKQTRLYLLGSYLDNLRTTLFRQTLFAEFELKIHDMAEHGESLSGEALSREYLKLVRQYYGHDAGVCKVDDLYGVEWSYIPHFYYDFYVYQYATSIIASTALAKGVREDAASGGKSTAHRDAYLNMLQSGSSKYPVDLLKGAGVDMTTSAPFLAAMKEMNSVMDEMEKLLK
jgi:oligoendopeptidase F